MTLEDRTRGMPRTPPLPRVPFAEPFQQVIAARTRYLEQLDEAAGRLGDALRGRYDTPFHTERQGMDGKVRIQFLSQKKTFLKEMLSALASRYGLHLPVQGRHGISCRGEKYALYASGRDILIQASRVPFLADRSELAEQVILLATHPLAAPALEDLLETYYLLRRRPAP
jgi:hypothetical protein